MKTPTIKVQHRNIESQIYKNYHLSFEVIKKKIENGADLMHYPKGSSFFCLREKLPNGKQYVWFLEDNPALLELSHNVSSL